MARSVVANVCDGKLDGLIVGILTAEGAAAGPLREIEKALRERGARLQLIVPGGAGALAFHLDDGTAMLADVGLDSGIRGSYWDAFVITPGAKAIRALNATEATDRLLRDIIRHRGVVGVYGDEDVMAVDEFLGDARCESDDDKPYAGRSIGAERMVRTSDAAKASDLIVQSQKGESIGDFVGRFAELASAWRCRELVDELSVQSFPASDSSAGTSI